MQVCSQIALASSTPPCCIISVGSPTAQNYTKEVILMDKNSLAHILESFATLHNPRTGIFIDKMQDMIRIYNHTDRICFDDKKVYLIAG